MVCVILESSFHSDVVHGGSPCSGQDSEAKHTASGQRSTAPTVSPVILQQFYHLPTSYWDISQSVHNND